MTIIASWIQKEFMLYENSFFILVSSVWYQSFSLKYFLTSFSNLNTPSILEKILFITRLWQLRIQAELEVKPFHSGSNLSGVKYISILWIAFWAGDLWEEFQKDIIVIFKELNEQLSWVGVIYYGKMVWGHPLSTYAKFSEKPTFLTTWYAHVRVRIRRLEMLVFRKILRTYLMDGPYYYVLISYIRRCVRGLFIEIT